MADRIIKPDDTNDLVLQNNDGSAKLELNEDQTVKVTTGSDAGEDFTVNSTQLVVEGDTGKIGIGTNAPQQHLEIHDTSNQAYVLINGGGANGATTSALQLGARSASGGNEIASVSAIRGGDTTGQLVFSVKTAANTITEKMRINSTGNVEISDGDLKIGTAGHGINFSAYATSGNPSSNLLDDYEEGTFNTDTMVFNSGGSVTMNGYLLRYTKIGSLVTCTGNLHFNTVTSQNGPLRVPLPFTSGTTDSRNRAVSHVADYEGGANVSLKIEANATFGLMVLTQGWATHTIGNGHTRLLTFSYHTDL